MDDQEDPPVQENPPMSLEGNLAENWTFFRESWESYKIATELDKKPKPVIWKLLR